MPVKHLTWSNIHQNGRTWISHHELRFRVFVERNKWQIPHSNGLEYDAYDNPSAHYLIQTNEAGIAKGVVRLIPTTSSYMIEDLWPDMIDGALPKTNTVWEASRFACDTNLDYNERKEVVADLVQATFEFGLSHGIKALLGVMPLGLFTRVLRPAGCDVEIIRSGYRIDTHRVALGRIPMTISRLRNVRRKRTQPTQQIPVTTQPPARALEPALT